MLRIYFSKCIEKNFVNGKLASIWTSGLSVRMEYYSEKGQRLNLQIFPENVLISVVEHLSSTFD